MAENIWWNENFESQERTTQTNSYHQTTKLPLRNKAQLLFSACPFKMQPKIFLALAGVFTMTQAAAVNNDDVLSKRACSLTPCKAEGKHDCVGSVYSSGTCINLQSSDGRPFISGWSAPGCTCVIYSNLDCYGDQITVDNAGYSRFPFNAISMESWWEEGAVDVAPQVIPLLGSMALDLLIIDIWKITNTEGWENQRFIGRVSLLSSFVGHYIYNNLTVCAHRLQLILALPFSQLQIARAIQYSHTLLWISPLTTTANPVCFSII
ncbi:hypothetical protein VTN00DRAFT_412 [Thermoascus crustaceus]|uniref:uncharacterized protein n=1 Tax=Thermoascus crustaceus TaxID=5088 RepID=UPI0037445C61